MKATDFEYRHPTLLHLAIVTIALSTYLIDRDDIVWAMVRGQPDSRLLERLLFTLATLLIGGATALRTWARACSSSFNSTDRSSVSGKGPYVYIHYPMQAGGLLFAIGVGFLAPLSDSAF
jgi:protein-S-isoprenylcysteine O-methyltransferase Ste14